MASVLTPLQLTAGAGLLQNSGLGVSANLNTALTAYTSSTVIDPLLNAISLGGGNVLLPATLSELKTIGNTTCAALGDSVPSAYSSLGVEPLTSLVSAQATKDTGSGDVSKYIQALSVAQGYADTTNQFIDSAVNSQTYLAGTFTNTDNMVSGDITAVSTNTTAWGSDLVNLGNLINLAALDEMGTPVALIKQLAAQGAVLPQIAIAFTAEGVPLEVIANLNSPTLSTTDQVQKFMYTAMTKITGTTLDQVLSILKVKTANIGTMADLLNPYKIFPNSFLTLTVPNKYGVSQNIYLDSTGTVNQTIAKGLPKYATSSIV